MRKQLLTLAALLGTLNAAATSFAQDETFFWDGDTSNNWFTTTNWEIFGGNPNPGLGDPPIPDAGTRVEIETDGTGPLPAPTIASGAALAHQVRIGRDMPGVLNMTGGMLTTTPGTIQFRVGNGSSGTLNLSGGTINVTGGSMTTGDACNCKGQINMTGGAINITGASRDLNMDESVGSLAGSNLMMTAGTISIADVLLVDNNASIDLLGGTITAAAEQAGAIRIRRDGAVRVSGGLLETKDDIEFGNGSIPGGSLAITGGVVRAFRISDIGATAAITLNGTGLLQVLNTQESISAMQARITSGLITSSGSLNVSLVNVGGLNYTQVAVAAVGLPGDANNDGKVDLLDLDILGANFGLMSGATVAQGDFNNDGKVDLLDLDILGANFGSMAAIATAVPEPTSLGVLAVIAAMNSVGAGRRR